jgi:hypothetical protein
VGRVLPIAVLGLGFLALLGLRVAFLIILRRDEDRPRKTKQHWPDATVIRVEPEETRSEDER